VARVFATVEDAARPFRKIYPEIPEERLQTFVSEGLRSVEGGFRMKFDPATYATWEPGDLRPMLPAARCPTLVLRGGESIVTSPEGITSLMDRLPDREVREIEGLASKAIRDFLRRRAVEVM
jgi:pimeloyl-ACP methyl ester carboxylesterase